MFGQSTHQQQFELKKAKEISVLNAVLNELDNAKQELSNDLTRIAMKNLPMIVQNEENVVSSASQEQSAQFAVASTSQLVMIEQLDPSSETSDQDGTKKLQELEPLDLDID